MIRIYCDAAHAVLKETEVLTSGMTNYPQVLLTFSEDWDGMGKVAVCRAGPSTEQSVDVEGLVTYALGSTFVVPSECLAQSGVELYIGIQGVNAQQEVAIPTIWVSAGTIMEGVDIDEAINTGTATPTLVQQMIAYAGQMEDTAEDLAQNVIRQVLVNDTYADRYGTVDVELTDTGAGENRQLTFTFANLKGNGLESIAFVSTGTNAGRVVVTESNGNVTNYDGIKDALEYVYNYIDHNVSTIITDYIELHPEYVTTVMDGAVSYQKLDTELQGLADIVRDLDTIPTRTSDLINDSNFVSDVNYVHTDSNYTEAEKTKLAGIEAGAEKNREYTPVTGSPGGNVTNLSFGGNFTVSQISQDENGQISATNRSIKIPDADATQSEHGLMSAADKTKLDTLDSADITDNSTVGGPTVEASLTSLKGSLNSIQGQITANIETSTTASKAYSAGEYLVLNGILYRVALDIQNGSTITIGTNVISCNAGTELTALTKEVSGNIEKSGAVTTGNLDSASCFKRGNVVFASGRIYGMTNQVATGNFFVLPNGFTPKQQIYGNAYIAANGSLIPTFCIIRPSGNVALSHSGTLQIDQVYFSCSFPI